MCRHLAYLGPPVRLSALLFDPPHSLSHQAWAPRDMRGGGTINADGYGVGWFPEPGTAPLRLRRDRPIWSDPDLRALTAATTAPAVRAAARSATPGLPIGEAACAPFRSGDGDRGWLFSLNGRIEGWPGTAVPLTRQLPPAELLTIDAPTDSALIWAVLRHRLRAGAAPAEAVTATVSDVLAAAPASRLNLLLTDGEQVVATTHTHALSLRSGADSTLIASEPLDDHPEWRSVPDNTLVVATASHVDMSILPMRGAR